MSQKTSLPLWQRLLITLAAMLCMSFVAGLIWKSAFNAAIPSYLGGMVGGLTVLPVWEFLRRLSPRG